TTFMDRWGGLKADDTDPGENAEVAAIIATLVAHQARQQALQISQGQSQRQSEWKWSHRRR
ncbi:MAG: hypothetical protein K8S97_07630, partial [Anaerolineae bacterium]|nr:hypothetical protein [Anaerolineae bacterium]